jgi:uncharacterized protein YbjT (DUF2867 family)
MQARTQGSADAPMRLFILGATGRTGRALLDQGRQRGHSVTAFVRSPEKLAELQDGVVARTGDPRNVDQLLAALAGHDAVLSALAPPGLGPATILSDAARSTVRAMQTAGVRRLLIVSVGILFDDAGILAPSSAERSCVTLRRTLPRWSASCGRAAWIGPSLDRLD